MMLRNEFAMLQADVLEFWASSLHSDITWTADTQGFFEALPRPRLARRECAGRPRLGGRLCGKPNADIARSCFVRTCRARRSAREPDQSAFSVQHADVDLVADSV